MKKNMSPCLAQHTRCTEAGDLKPQNFMDKKSNVRRTGYAGQIRKALLLFVCLAATTLCAVAQEKGINVTGTVTDAQGESLIGVAIRVTGAAVGTVTDADGKYQIAVPSGASELQFTYMGYVTVREATGSRRIINVTMSEDTKVIDEVVVVGYAVQRRANLTGAVGTVDVAKQLEGRPLPDLGRGLQGAVPGMSVTSTSGRIGSTPSIKIRGAIGSLIDGASAPLILVDGVEISDLSLINPDDVADISVLKDAASSSIYGTRAAFGVVLITTRKGDSKGKFSINYSNNFSWAKATVLPKAVKSYEGAEMSLEMRRRESPGAVSYTQSETLVYTEESIERMKEWERVYGGLNLSSEMVYGRDFETISGTTYFYRSFDAPSIYIKEYSPSQQHNISVSGSTGKTNIYLGLGYMGQGGVVKAKPDEFDRYSVNLNMDTKVNDWLTARGKFLYSRTNLQTPFNFNSTAYDALYYLYRWPANMPYGTYQGKPFHNPVTEVAAANYDNDIKDYMRASIGATIDFTKELSLDVDYTFNKDDQMITQRGGEVGGWDIVATNGQLVEKKNWAAVSRNKIDQYFYHRDYHAGNAVLRYKKNINLHKINVFAGMNIEQKETVFLNGWKYGLLDFSKPEFDLAVGNTFTYDANGYPTFNQGEFVDGAHSDWAIFGFFGRINYSFADRYLLEVNGRYDGSSKFPVNQQFGFFPSASAGWIFTEESFLEAIKPILSFGKIRASYGSVGNQAVGDNRFRAILASGVSSGWVISGNEKTFGIPPAISPDFTWETIETKNLGFDLRFLDDKLGLSADIYQRINKDMIASGEEVPSFFGASAPYTNIGELTTKGWEIGADFHHIFSNGLKLGVTASLSDALSTITDHRNGLGTAIDGSNYKGKVYGEIWGFETDRFFTEADFAHDASGNRIIVNGVTQMAEGNASQSKIESAYTWFHYEPGDVKYRDLDGNGIIDWGDNSPENPGDMKRIGNTTPRYEYNSRISLEWKGIDFELFIQGVGKRDYWSASPFTIPGYKKSDATFYTHQTNYWTPENTGAFYPRMTPYVEPSQYTRAAAINFMPQTKYLLDMSYCRIKNITLGYSLPANLIRKVKAERLRIYASLENVAELDHLGDIPIDPETGVPTGSDDRLGFGRIYPFTRSFSFGVQLKF
jgi:TonB-linked SusC/RagA family outer membrane protein